MDGEAMEFMKSGGSNVEGNFDHLNSSLTKDFWEQFAFASEATARQPSI